MTVVLSVDQNLISQALSNKIEYLADAALKLTSFKEHIELKIGEYDGTI